MLLIINRGDWYIQFSPILSSTYRLPRPISVLLSTRMWAFQLHLHRYLALLKDINLHIFHNSYQFNALPFPSSPIPQFYKAIRYFFLLCSKLPLFHLLSSFTFPQFLWLWQDANAFTRDLLVYMRFSFKDLTLPLWMHWGRGNFSSFSCDSILVPCIIANPWPWLYFLLQSDTHHA